MHNNRLIKGSCKKRQGDHSNEALLQHIYNMVICRFWFAAADDGTGKEGKLEMTMVFSSGVFGEIHTWKSWPAITDWLYSTVSVKSSCTTVIYSTVEQFLAIRRHSRLKFLSHECMSVLQPRKLTCVAGVASGCWPFFGFGGFASWCSPRKNIHSPKQPWSLSSLLPLWLSLLALVSYEWATVVCLCSS